MSTASKEGIGLTSLPPELFISILTLLHTSTTPSPQPLFARLCLVSRHFRTFAAPLLYSAIQLEQRWAVASLARALRDGSDCGDLIKTLCIIDEEGRKISGQSSEAEEEAVAVDIGCILKRSRYLESLELAHWGKFMLNSAGRKLWYRALSPLVDLPSLTSLSIDNCELYLDDLPRLSFITHLSLTKSGFTPSEAVVFTSVIDLVFRCKVANQMLVLPRLNFMWGLVEKGSLRSLTVLGEVEDRTFTASDSWDKIGGPNLEVLHLEDVRVDLAPGNVARYDPKNYLPSDSPTSELSKNPLPPSIRPFTFVLSMQVPSHDDLPTYMSFLKYFIYQIIPGGKISFMDLSVTVWKQIPTNWELRSEIEGMIEVILKDYVVNLERKVILRGYEGSSQVFRGGFW